MICRFISKEETEIEKVIALGVKYSRTLGFMPEGGFYEHARKGLIVTAIENDEILGYVLFRIVKKNHKLTIVHLCVDKPYRKKGVSDALMNFIKGKYEYHLDGIILNCRRDYKAATKFWERYGFKVVNYQASRSQIEKQLVKWYYHFGNNNLFDNNYPVNYKELSVSLDTNIIIKYSDSFEVDNKDANTPETIEVKSLFADWISTDVKYFFASETNNEINRNENWQDVLRSRNVLSKLTAINADVHIVRKKEEDLRTVIKGNAQNDVSDRRQIAECIAANIEFFITLDNGILDRSEELYDEYKISVYRPAEFIVHIDQIINQSQYHPSRLAGARYEERKASSDELEDLVEYFIYNKQSERKSEFRTQVYSTASNIRISTINTIKSPDGKYNAFWGYTLLQDKVDIKFIRVKGELANTLIKQLISNIIKLSVSHNKQLISVSDKYLSEELTNQLQEFGFFYKDNLWLKISLSGLVSIYNLPTVCTSIDIHTELASIIDKYDSVADSDEKRDVLYTVERALYPVKIVELSIPTYIVPIKAYWASQLFDYVLADSTIYGARPEISWNRETVYYRSPFPGNERSVGRILWYVSYDDKFPGRSKAITACSCLDEVIVDTAKKSYNTYKRFGIYEWRDILSKAKGDVFGKIKVLKFSDTEVFKSPVKLKTVQDFLGKQHTFVSPLEINSEEFQRIYVQGKI